MRFNKQEMITLAQQPSNKFDKEGLLFVRERQEGFFRRTESEYLLVGSKCINKKIKIKYNKV